MKAYIFVHGNDGNMVLLVRFTIAAFTRGTESGSRINSGIEERNVYIKRSEHLYITFIVLSVLINFSNRSTLLQWIAYI